jgi:ribose 5-phosphate isomerase B
MKVFFATDHAGYELKNELIEYVGNELGYEVEDMGAYELNAADDYPDFVHKAAQAVSEDPENRRAIILGGSGQGEAMVANRYKGVRAAVYYGEPSSKQIDNDRIKLDILASTRKHNNANVLSLGARFLTVDDAKEAVRLWLSIEYESVDRHERRIQKIDIM